MKTDKTICLTVFGAILITLSGCVSEPNRVEKVSWKGSSRATIDSPGLTGKEIKKNLQNYNLVAIRQGFPPLPIPLTEEQDKQLVEEGILLSGEGGPPGIMRYKKEK